MLLFRSSLDRGISRIRVRGFQDAGRSYWQARSQCRCGGERPRRHPERMRRPFALQHASVLAQVAKQGASFHRTLAVALEHSGGLPSSWGRCPTGVCVSQRVCAQSPSRFLRSLTYPRSLAHTSSDALAMSSTTGMACPSLVRSIVFRYVRQLSQASIRT